MRSRGSDKYLIWAADEQLRAPSRAVYVLSLPARLVRVVRWNRGAIPALRIYLAAAIIGLLVGLTMYFAFDWIWWPFPLGAVVLTAVAFAATAFTKPGRRRRMLSELRLELDNTVSPAKARERYHRREAQRYAAADFPLYGLPPEWTGLRFFGSSSETDDRTTSLGLAHQPSGVDGPRLDVETYAGSKSRDELADEVALQALQDPDDLAWSPLAVRVNGAEVRFDLHSSDDEWWAVGRIDDHTVVLNGHDFPAEDLELVQITDLEPYREGLSRLDDRLGAGS